MAILDQGPPPPPGVGAPQQPSLSAMAGSGQPAGNGGGDPMLQRSILEKMMLVEKTLQSAATEMPAIGPVVNDLIQQFRARVGPIVLSQSAPDQSQQGGIGALVAGPSPAPATS